MLNTVFKQVKTQYNVFNDKSVFTDRITKLDTITRSADPSV